MKFFIGLIVVLTILKLSSCHKATPAELECEGSTGTDLKMCLEDEGEIQ